MNGFWWWLGWLWADINLAFLYVLACSFLEESFMEHELEGMWHADR